MHPRSLVVVVVVGAPTFAASAVDFDNAVQRRDREVVELLLTLMAR